jgi:steroid delta-isomerase-like uncharacterized protein
MTTTETNRQFFDRWFGEVWNKGNYDVAYQVIDPDFTVHGAGGQDVKQGPEGVVGLVKTWREAFPDGQMIIHDVVSEGDIVAIRMTWEGTHSGDFYGIPPSNKKIHCTSIGLDRVRNGKVSEGWGELDMLGMMQQMGAMPTFGQRVWATWGDRAGQPGGGEAGAGVAEMKETLLRFFRAVNADDADALRALVNAGSYVDHNPTVGAGNIETTLRTYRTMRAAMPDLHFEPDVAHMIVEGDRVFARWVATGTHTGARFYGLSATGRKATWTGSDLVRIANGKIVDRWLCGDTLTLLQQLDVIPHAG